MLGFEPRCSMGPPWVYRGAEIGATNGMSASGLGGSINRVRRCASFVAAGLSSAAPRWGTDRQLAGSDGACAIRACCIRGQAKRILRRCLLSIAVICVATRLCASNPSCPFAVAYPPTSAPSCHRSADTQVTQLMIQTSPGQPRRGKSQRTAHERRHQLQGFPVGPVAGRTILTICGVRGRIVASGSRGEGNERRY